MTRSLDRIPLPQGNETNPNYFVLGADGFEDLCEALLNSDKNLIDVARVDPKGKKQWGIDIRGRDRADGSETVLSAKCERRAEKQKLINWSNDFLKHWASYWQSRNVRTFIVACAEPHLTDTSSDQLTKERARFKRHGISYEYWGASQITERCSARPDIVSRFFARGWSALLSPETEGRALDQLTAHNALLQGSIKRAAVERVESLIDAYREGRQRGLVEALADLERDPASWLALGIAQRARVYRIKAERLVMAGAYSQALIELGNADAVDGSRDGRAMRAYFTMFEGRPSSGLSLLKSPKNDNERCIRAVLHIAGRKADAALADLDMLPETSEFLRLRAIAEWVQGHEEKALNRLEQLATTFSRDFIVRKTLVRVLYASVFPRIMPLRLDKILTPYPLALVREDDEALAALRRVDDLSRSLLLHPLETHEQHELEILRLASLAFRRNTIIEAARYAAHLVSRQAPNGHAIRWCLTYGWLFDREVAKALLQEALRDQDRQFDQLEAFLILCGTDGQHSEALQALLTYRGEFSLPEHVQTLNRAKKHIDKALRHPQQSGAQPLTLDELAQRVGHEPTPATIIEWWLACEALARQSAWAQLLPAVPFLDSHLPTAEAARLKIFVCFHTKGSEPALAAMDQLLGRFPAKTLPQSLRRLRIKALIDTGRLVSAREESVALAAFPALPQDRLLAIQAANQLADYESVVAQARDMPPAELAPRDALYIAQVVASHDPALARIFWNQAHTSGIPDELTPLAAVLGFKLDLGEVMRGVMARFASYAQRPDTTVATVASLDEVIVHFKAVRQHADQVAELWRVGAAPIHALVPRASDLARYWASVLKVPGQAIPFPWLIHAGNRIDKPVRPEVLRLCLDITAVFTAWHLNLLDLLEANAELYIPADLLDFLRDAQEELLPVQPSQVRARDAVLELVKGGRVALVDQFPSDQPAVGFAADETYSASLSTFLRDLALAANYDDEQLTAARDLLGSSVVDPPGSGTLLHAKEVGFDIYALKTFADSFLIQDALACWRITVRRQQVEELARERLVQDGDVLLSTRMDALRKRLLVSVTQHNIRILPRSAEEERSFDANGHGPALELLFGLLNSQVPPGAWIWIDDRAFHGLSGGGRTIVNVVDVIDAMYARQKMPQRDWLQMRTRIREAGALFVPPEGEEVAAAYQRRSQTAAARSLALSQFLLASHSAWLRIDATATGNDSFPLESIGAIKAVLAAPAGIAHLWRGALEKPEDAAAASDLILRNLARPWWSTDLVQCSAEVTEHIQEMQFVSLLLGPFGWEASDQAELQTRLSLYGSWLQRAIVDPLATRSVAAKGRLLSFAAERFRRFVEEAETRIEPTDVRALQITAARWLLAMPAEITDLIAANTAFFERLPISAPSRIVTLGPFRSEVTAYFERVALALDEGSAIVDDSEGRAWTLQVNRSEDHLLPTLELRGAKQRFLISDPAVFAASTQIEDRKALLAEHPEFWDGAYATAQLAEQYLHGFSAPIERIDALDAMRADSAEFLYRRVAAQIDAGGRLAFSELRPISAQFHLRYLRIEPDLDLANAASSLLKQRGLHESVRRYASFPDDLPAPILSELEQAEEPVRSDIVKELLNSTSIVHRLHGIKLSATFAPEVAAGMPAARALLREGEVQLQAYHMLLQWAHSHFCAQDTPSPTTRMLAWAHIGAVLHALPRPQAWDEVARGAKVDAPRDFAAAFASPVEPDDSLDPNEFSVRKTYASFGELILHSIDPADLDDDTLAAVMAAICLSAGDDCYPHPDALPRTAPRSGAGAWLRLSPDRLYAICAVHAESSILELTLQWQRSALEALFSDVYRNEAWTLLINVCPPTDVDAQSALSLAHAVKTIVVQQLRTNCRDAVFAAITQWTALVSQRVESDALAHFVNSLIEQVFLTHDESDFTWIEALLVSARNWSTEQAMQSLALRLRQLLDLNPAHASRIALVVTTIERFATSQHLVSFRGIELRLQEIALSVNAPFEQSFLPSSGNV